MWVLQAAFCVCNHSWAVQVKLRPPLLAMLGDADPEVQGRALAFWHSALPRSLSARLASLLSDTLEVASAWVRAPFLPLGSVAPEQGSYANIHTFLLPWKRVWAPKQALSWADSSLKMQHCESSGSIIPDFLPCLEGTRLHDQSG